MLRNKNSLLKLANYYVTPKKKIRRNSKILYWSRESIENKSNLYVIPDLCISMSKPNLIKNY